MNISSGHLKYIIEVIKYISYVLFVVGCIISLFSLYFVVARLVFLITSEKTEASIVSTTKINSNNVGVNRNQWKPVLSFKTKLGESVEYESNIVYDQRTLESNFPDGKGTILYNPKDPTESFVFSFRGFWLLPIVGVLIGVVLITIGLFFVKYLKIFNI